MPTSDNTYDEIMTGDYGFWMLSLFFFIFHYFLCCVRVVLSSFVLFALFANLPDVFHDTRESMSQTAKHIGLGLDHIIGW